MKLIAQYTCEVFHPWSSRVFIVLISDLHQRFAKKKKPALQSFVRNNIYFLEETVVSNETILLARFWFGKQLIGVRLRYAQLGNHVLMNTLENKKMKMFKRDVQMYVENESENIHSRLTNFLRTKTKG